MKTSNGKTRSNKFPLAIQILVSNADLRIATRYVQDVFAQTDKVIENSRMYICQNMS